MLIIFMIRHTNVQTRLKYNRVGPEMDLTLSGLGPPDPFVEGCISSNVAWRWRLWKTLVPIVVKDEAFKRWNPSSNFSRALETGLLPQVVAQIWIKTSLSPTCRAETVGNDVPVSGTLVPSSWAVIIVTSPGFEEILDIFNTISSFLCMSPSTCFCCSGMYFNTREMVAGMLNFFCNASILSYKHNSYKGTSLRPPLHNGLAVTQVKRKGGRKRKKEEEIMDVTVCVWLCCIPLDQSPEAWTWEKSTKGSSSFFGIVHWRCGSFSLQSKYHVLNAWNLQWELVVGKKSPEEMNRENPLQ